MMKKKSMAVAMAAVTVAMPMTQSFAAVVDDTQTAEINAMKEKALKLLNLKFTAKKNLLKNPTVAEKHVFKAVVNGAEYDNYSDFERAFDNAYNDLKNGETLEVSYRYAQTVGGVEIGYNTLVDGTIVDFDTDTYKDSDLNTLSTGKDGSLTGEATGLKVGEVQFKIDADDKTKTYQIKLNDGKELSNGVKEKRFVNVKAGDEKLSLTSPLLREEKGYYVDIDGNAIAEAKDGDIITLVNDPYAITLTNASRTDAAALSTKLTDNAVIDGFKVDTTKDAQKPAIVSDVIKKGNVVTSLNSSEMFNSTEGRLTVKGNELLSRVEALKANLYDINYNIKVTEPTADKELKIVVEKKSKQDRDFVKVEEIKITRDDADKKSEAYNAIRDIVLSNTFDTTKQADGVTPTYANSANYAGKIATAAGADRYATAAELSKKQFTGANPLGTTAEGTEKAVVLVTGEQDKLVDGLTATPLAASLNKTADNSKTYGAPVLLTGNSKLAQPAIDEMKRLGAEKVYIVGGAISETVEKELENRYGMDVERVSGDDRYDTSLEVANEIHDITGEFNNVFVAGGKSEADALSAGSIAANLKAPIILTSEAKLNKDAKYFLEGTKVNDAAKVYVVGGSVSKDAYNSILDAHNNVKRLSGDNRQDTNAKVIEEFFVKDNKATHTPANTVVVAKSDNKGMVDALGAGLYAGLNNAPVVLATNSITKDQEDALNKISDAEFKKATNAKISKLQVGEGISSAVAKFIKDLKGTTL